MRTNLTNLGRIVAILLLAMSVAYCGAPSKKAQKSRYNVVKDRIEAYASKTPKLKADITKKVAEFDKELAATKGLATDKVASAMKTLVDRMEAYEKAIKPKTTAKAPTKPKLKGKLKSKVKSTFGIKKPACIDVNTASGKDLMALRGIGPALAGKIIMHRSKKRAAATRATQPKWNYRHWAGLMKAAGLSRQVCLDNRTKVCFNGRIQKTCPVVAVKKAPTAVKRGVTQPVAPRPAGVKLNAVKAKPVVKTKPLGAKLKSKKVAPKKVTPKKSKSGFGGK
jgi:DNA uptake protein ComE-like DNA-binding protein